jgi:hypothetical protein
VTKDIRAPAERPAPEDPQPLRDATGRAFDNFMARKIAAQGIGTRAWELWQDLLDKDDRTSSLEYPTMALISFDEFRDYLSAAASEREAAAMRAFGQRVWSDTEEVAYQAGATDEHAALLARLREPDVIEAVTDAYYHACRSYTPGTPGWDHLAHDVIARIVEVLK